MRTDDGRTHVDPLRGYFDGPAKTYTSDLDLFKELGLETFAVNDRDEHEVGFVQSEDGTVRIWVTCLPAMFWRFEIFCSENKMTTEISTGSGGLVDYWETVIKKVLQGMVVVDKVVDPTEALS